MATILYLLTIILANLTVAHFGPPAAGPVAFVAIGLDLTLRDHLHERWNHQHLPQKMALLIASGSILSWALNRDARDVAVASLVAFALATAADTIAYHFLRHRPRLLRINTSNAISATIDSAAFVTLAFGLPLQFGTILAQIAAKTAGGFLWSLALRKARP